LHSDGNSEREDCDVLVPLPAHVHVAYAYQL
jgi:hypothetical protein